MQVAYSSKMSIPVHTVRHARRLEFSVTFLLDNKLMEQSPSWEANSFSASQEIPRILWSPKADYRGSPLFPIPNQIDSVKLLPSSYFNIILPSMPRSSSGLFPQVFTPEPSMHLPPIHATCPTYLILSCRNHNICFVSTLLYFFFENPVARYVLIQI